MTAETDLLPMPEWAACDETVADMSTTDVREAMNDYARACVSSATEALRAERDLFRAETIALAKDADAMRAGVERYKVAWEEFSDRTEWVQQTAKPRELGMHRADVLRLRIEQAEARAERLAEALRWYANPEVYKPHPHGPAFDRRDLSFVARAALEQETTNG